MYLLFLRLGDNVPGLNCRFNQQSHEKDDIEISFIISMCQRQRKSSYYKKSLQQKKRQPNRSISRKYVRCNLLLVKSLSNVNGASNCTTDHWVVTDAEESHHLKVCRCWVRVKLLSTTIDAVRCMERFGVPRGIKQSTPKHSKPKQGPPNKQYSAQGFAKRQFYGNEHKKRDTPKRSVSRKYMVMRCPIRSGMTITRSGRA